MGTVGSSEEQSTNAAKEEAITTVGIAYKEPTTYDNVLKRLLSKESFANLYKEGDSLLYKSYFQSAAWCC